MENPLYIKNIVKKSLKKNPHQIDDEDFRKKGDEPSLRTRRSKKKELVFSDKLK